MTPARDEHLAANWRVRTGQGNGAYCCRVAKHILEHQHSHIVQKVAVALVHNHLGHLADNAATQTIHGTSTNAQQAGRCAVNINTDVEPDSLHIIYITLLTPCSRHRWSRW